MDPHARRRHAPDQATAKLRGIGVLDPVQFATSCGPADCVSLNRWAHSSPLTEQASALLIRL